MIIVDDLKALNKTQRAAFVASFLGWSLDAFDYFLLTFILKDIAGEFHAKVAEVSTAIEALQLHAFDYLCSDHEAFARALEIQRHALNAGFHRALSLPDLLIAATAELNRRTVLHYDGDFDMIASLTGQPTECVVPPGSADR